MDSIDSNRRRILTLGGTGAVLALAGCLDTLDGGGGGDDGGSMPAYADDLVTGENGNVVAFYTTWDEEEFPGGVNNETGGGIIGGGPDDETGGGIIGGGNNETGGGIIGGGTGGQGMEGAVDPLLFPVASPVFVGLFAGFTLGFTPLAPVLGLSGGGLFGGQSGGQGDEESVKTEITELLMTVSGDGFALVMNGDIDTEEVGELLTGDGGGSGTLGLTYSEAGERNGYTRYELDADSDSTESDSGNITLDVDAEGLGGIAVDSGSILVGSPGALDRLTGDAGSAVDESDTLSWLLGASGDGEFGVTMHAPDGFQEAAMEQGENQNSTGDIGGGVGTGPSIGNETQQIIEALDTTVTGLSGTASETGDGQQFDVQMGMSFGSDVGSDLEETIRSTFGTSTDDVSYEFDGNRVTISGTVSGSSLGGGGGDMNGDS